MWCGATRAAPLAVALLALLAAGALRLWWGGGGQLPAWLADDGDLAFCQADGMDQEVVAPWLEVVDCDVHLNDPMALPRRGSMALSMLQWVPHAEVRTFVAGFVSHSRTQLLALNAEEDMRHILSRFRGREFEALSGTQNVTHFVAVESTSQLAPHGQAGNVQVHATEAKWLATQAAAAVVASGGGESAGRERRESYLRQLGTLSGVRGVRWVAAFTPGHMPLVHSWSESANPSAHLRALGDIAEARPDWLIELFVFHPQLPMAKRFAKRFPNTRLVVTHAGGPFMCRRPLLSCEEYVEGLESLAQLPNVWLKISGLGSLHAGLGYRAQRPDTAQLVQDWRDLVLFAVRKFGEDRVVFGSNFPLDQGAFDYSTFWNAIKTIVTEAFPPPTQRKLLKGNAMRLYGLS